MSLPYLDTEEKLREFTRKTWRINIAPCLISAKVDGKGNVTIFPSYSYNMTHQQLNCTNLNHGTISVEKISFVHPCVLPVLEEAYSKKEREDTLKQNSFEEARRKHFNRQLEQSFKISLNEIAREKQCFQKEIEDMKNYQPPARPSLLTLIRNFFKRNQKSKPTT